MAFPTPDDTSKVVGSSTPGTNDFTVTLPNNLVAGDLIWVQVSRYIDTLSTTDSGWDSRTFQGTSGNGKTYILTKISDGTETVINMTGGGSHNDKKECHIAVRITGAPATGYLFYSVTPNTGNGTSADCPNCDPASGAQDFLWMAILGCDGRANYSDKPTDYTLIGSVNGGAFNNNTIALAYRQLNAASEDPGAYTISAVRNWGAQTFAIFPAASGGGTGGAYYYKRRRSTTTGGRGL